MQLLDGSPAWHWALGGSAIAAVTLLLLFLTNKRLGISSGFENLCSFVVRTPYLLRSEITRSHTFRLPFLAGLVAGGFLAAVTTAGFEWTWALGIFDREIGWGVAGKVVWMFAGGVLIGAGTRMAGGCTSGHGIFGLSNFERAGLAATLSYMAAGMVTTNLVYRVLS